jgi:hypothetical protein
MPLPRTTPPVRQFVARRTESDMLSMAPLKLRLGTADYTVPVLNNKKAAEWRDKLYRRLAPLVAAFDFSGIDLTAPQQIVSQAMSTKLSQELIAFPLELKALAQEFAPGVLTDEAFENASDEQICLAFAQIAEVGYPFFFHLWATKRALSMPAQKIPTDPANMVV